jgi:CHAT domain-containing protein
MLYVGVAAWTQPPDTRNVILRAISGTERSQPAPLPDSKVEVETVAMDLPKPSTILLGADATESRFKHLPLKSTDVIHLALHGYADLDYPDRSALIFAPDPSGSEDGLLQVCEIRRLHLNARLVALSACDTGVGPVGEAGVANLVSAFIEAGADSVVPTLDTCKKCGPLPVSEFPDGQCKKCLKEKACRLRRRFAGRAAPDPW